jgi:hypothetical protein
METFKPKMLLATAIAIGLTTFAGTRPAAAESNSDEINALRAQVQELQDAAVELRRLRDEVRELRTTKDDNWLDERRAEEVKGLIREVLSDADTRASLLNEGLTAGHDGKHFFLASEDGTFLMNISGQFQLRYVYNARDDTFNDANLDGLDDDPIDDEESGFQLRRTKLTFSGHVGSPKFEYLVRLASSRATSTVFVEDATVAYQVMDGVKVGAGRRKLPFLREELTSSTKQLAVDRASVTEVFTLNRAEGIYVELKPMENVMATVMLSDGTNSVASDFHVDRTEAMAVTARVDVALAGDLKQAKDFSAWSGEPMGIFLGAAIHYEAGESGDSVFANDPNFLSWTVDGSIEVSGFNLYAAIMGTEAQDVPYFDFSGVSPTGVIYDDLSAIGVLVQGGFFVIPDKLEPFIRWEWMQLDGGPNQTVSGGPNGARTDVQLLTFGANYYINKHNAKFTLDVVWALDSLNGAVGGFPGGTAANLGGASAGASGNSSGLGLLADDANGDGQVAVRAQFQLLF